MLKKHVEKIHDICKENIEYKRKHHPYLNLILSPKRMTMNQRTHLIEKIQKISHFLDHFIKIPLLPISIGFDTILGFIPFFGSITSVFLSLYQVWLSCTLGIPIWLLCTMVLNILVNFIFTFIPFIGGFYHMYYTCNTLNYQDLLDWLNHPTPEYTKRISEGERRPSSAGMRPGEITMTQLKQDSVNYLFNHHHHYHEKKE